MSEENCTLNQNGTLKEAHNITWYNDLDDEIPISQPSGKKKKTTKRRLVESFLDLEAEVLTELPTDDKADTDHADNFIDDHFNDEDIDGTDNEYNIPISQLALTRAVESVPNHGFIGYLLDKYGNNEGSSESPKETNSQLTKSKHSISHEGIRDDDWPLFDVPVKDGTEELIVYALSYQAGSKHICSAFASVVIPGHVYVEARNISDIQAVTSIYQDVYSKYICPVPTEVWVSFYKVNGSMYIPSQHTWVRLKGKYHYDLAFITNVCQCTLRIDIIHLPRVVYKRSLKQKQSPGSSKSRPHCDPFNPDLTRKTSPDKFEVQHEGSDKNVITGYLFRGSFYTMEGFIL
ncbi:hypothetical protein BDQ17DRAFT_1437934 [Cyathus striatus]|nr:hypothetical protein BDQ17DRAFT_1437934 [Cyathus striatus]